MLSSPRFTRRPDRSQRTREARYSSADISGKEALLPPRDRDERISPLLQDLSAEQKITMTVFYNQGSLKAIRVCLNQRVSNIKEQNSKLILRKSKISHFSIFFTFFFKISYLKNMMQNPSQNK